MRSGLGSAGFTNQERALKPRWGSLSLLAQLRCLLCKAFFKGCSLFENATLWHALLHPIRDLRGARLAVSSAMRAPYRAVKPIYPSGDNEICGDPEKRQS